MVAFTKEGDSTLQGKKGDREGPAKSLAFKVVVLDQPSQAKLDWSQRKTIAGMKSTAMFGALLYFS